MVYSLFSIGANKLTIICVINNEKRLKKAFVSNELFTSLFYKHVKPANKISHVQAFAYT